MNRKRLTLTIEVIETTTITIVSTTGKTVVETITQRTEEPVSSNANTQPDNQTNPSAEQTAQGVTGDNHEIPYASLPPDCDPHPDNDLSM